MSLPSIMCYKHIIKLLWLSTTFAHRELQVITYMDKWVKMGIIGQKKNYIQIVSVISKPFKSFPDEILSFLVCHNTLYLALDRDRLIMIIFSISIT